MLDRDEEPFFDVDTDLLNFVEVQLNEVINDGETVPPTAELDVLDLSIPIPVKNSSNCDCAVEIKMLKTELDETTAKLNEKSTLLEEKTTQLNEKSTQLTEKSSALEEALLELKTLRQKLADAETIQKEQPRKAQLERVIGEMRDNDKMTNFYTGFKSWNLFTTVFNTLTKSNGFVHQECKILTRQQEFLLTLMRLRLNLSIADLAYRFNIYASKVSIISQRWIEDIFYQLPASNISGPGVEKPWIDGKKNVSKMDVEEKLRKSLKIKFKLLDENLALNEWDIKDELGFSFIYKATYVCDYLKKLNKDSPSSSTLNL